MLAILDDEQPAIDQSESRTGRPRVMTVQAQAKILQSLRDGCFIRTAGRLAGMSHDTFYYWRRRVQRVDPKANAYIPFCRDVKVASAEAEQNALRTVRSGMPG
jgi:hypothetical protein